MWDKILLGLIFGFSLFYIFFISLIPDAMVMSFKLIPMLLIITLAICKRAGNVSKFKILIIIGLIFCAIGDYTLQWFLLGLTSFFIGHIFYISAFSTTNEKPVPISIKISLFCYGAIMAIWIGSTVFKQGDGILSIAVALYIAVILTMGWTAVRTGSKFALIGALSFILSDSILAINKFVIDVPFSHQAIMLTYYLAQLLIALSISQYSAFRGKEKLQSVGRSC